MLADKTDASVKAGDETAALAAERLLGLDIEKMASAFRKIESLAVRAKLMKLIVAIAADSAAPQPEN